MSDLTLVSGPLELWWAAVGTSFPAISGDPGAGGFTKIGASGAKNYTDDAVSINPGQTVEPFIPYGGTHPRKAFRTEEELIVTVTMADVSLAQVRSALNQNTVTSNAGDDEISLERGLDVSTIALLVRGSGKSPEFDGGNLQFELFEVYEQGSQEITFEKGAPAGVLLEFRAIDESSNGIGVIRAATS